MHLESIVVTILIVNMTATSHLSVVLRLQVEVKETLLQEDLKLILKHGIVLNLLFLAEMEFEVYSLYLLNSSKRNSYKWFVATSNGIASTLVVLQSFFSNLNPSIDECWDIACLELH